MVYIKTYTSVHCKFVQFIYIYIYCKFRLACEGVIGSKKEKKRNAAVVFQRFFPQQLLLTFSVLIPSHFSKSKSCSAQMKNS